VCCSQACIAKTRVRREHKDESWSGNGNGDRRGREQLQRIAAAEAAAAMVAWDPRELGAANTEREYGRRHERGDGHCYGNGRGEGSGIWRRR
jgi:hypothetical protein